MDWKSLLVNGALTAASIAFPEAAPVLAFIKAAEPYAEAAIPVVQAAIKEGPGAFAAAKAQAPEFMGELSKFAVALRGADAPLAEPTDEELAQLAAHVVGVDPPGWAHEDTLRWWARADLSTS